MANSYSSNLRLIIQTTGSNLGLWGDYTNTNIATLLEQAITGIGAIAVSGSSNYTLSTANGASDESRNAILNVTGTLTAAINIVCPTVSKTYIIKNGTTGGFAVTLKTSAGTGISVPNGSTMFLYCDGTNVVEAVNYQTSGKFSSLTDTGLTSGRVTYAGTGGLLQDSTNLTFDGTTLTAGGLTTAGNLTLSGGTANGVLYLNGSKQATSGSALVFDGTNFGVGGSSNNYGANITYLSIYGSTASGLDFYNGATRNGALYSTSGDVNLGSVTSIPIRFIINGSEQMRLTSTGLGIGTSSPAYKFVVSNAGAQGFEFDPSTGLVQVYNRSTSAYGEFRQYASQIRWFTGSSPTETMRLDSSGNLGLGVTPSAYVGLTNGRLEVGAVGNSLFSNGSTNFWVTTNTNYNSGYKYATTGVATMYLQSAGQHQWYTAPSGTAGNAISFTQAMTLDASGNLLVGTTSTTGSGKVNMAFASGSNGFSAVSTDNTTNASFMQMYANGSFCGNITRNGTSNAVLYNTSSDYRLKNITSKLTGYKERIMALQPKQGTWKTDGSEFRGFLAHEFAEQYKASVIGEKDAIDEEGNPIMQAMQASSPEVIADLVAYIHNLETRLAALEGK